MVALAAAVPDVGLSFAVTVALPVLALCWLATTSPREKAAGRLALALGGIALAAFAAAYAAAADKDGGLLGETARNLSDMLAAMKDIAEQVDPGNSDFSIPPDDVIHLTAMLVPGTSLACWAAFIVAGNGFLAEGVLARFGGRLVPPPTMASIALPRTVSLGFAAALATALIGQGEVAFVGVSLAAFLAVPLMYLGLGVIHARLDGHPDRVMLLAVFYTVFFGLAIPLIVALGVIEQWVGLRRRLIPAPRQGEE
jgi:hypothetical protein